MEQGDGGGFGLEPRDVKKKAYVVPMRITSAFYVGGGHVKRLVQIQL